MFDQRSFLPFLVVLASIFLTTPACGAPSAPHPPHNVKSTRRIRACAERVLSEPARFARCRPGIPAIPQPCHILYLVDVVWLRRRRPSSVLRSQASASTESARKRCRLTPRGESLHAACRTRGKSSLVTATVDLREGAGYLSVSE